MEFGDSLSIREILKVPKCARVESAITILKFVEVHGLPIVVKPTA
jgi:hypothetical protein